MSRILHLSLLVVPLCLLGFGVPAGAEDEPIEYVEWSFEAFRAAPAIAGPVLSTPADFQGLIEDPGDADQVWELVGGNASDWIRFEETETGPWALPSDVLSEVLHTIHGDLFESRENHALDTFDDHLLLTGTAASNRKVQATLDWAVGGFAPSLGVRASYGLVRPEARALATGGTVLHPRRWTRLFLQRRSPPFCVDFDIEIAQEATAMDPILVSVPEGQELYLCYHPGETVSLIEVWSGEVKHDEVRRIDLGSVRNVPEGNAPGVVTFPVSRILRAHAVLRIENGKAAARTFEFEQDGRVARLNLAFDAPPTAHAAIRNDRPRPSAIVRMDAAAGSLSFGAREREAGAWIERMVGSALARGFEEDDLQMQHIASGGCVYVEGLPAALAHLRRTIARQEARLVEERVALQVVSLDEATYRQAAKQLRVGKAVPEALRTQVLASAGRSARLQLPVLQGIPAGVRAGFSEPGLYDFDVDVALKSSAMDPQTTAHFRGLSGVVHVTPARDSVRLALRGALAWADAEASTLELTFRPPVSMDVQRDRWIEEPDVRRTAKLPVIGAGASPIDTVARIVKAARDVPHVLGIVIRGGEAHLVLGTLRAR